MKTFNEQAQASIDEIDMEAAQKRLDAMNLSKPGPTLTPAQDKPQRKQRSDKGVPKKLSADQDEIVLRVDWDEARGIALRLSETPWERDHKLAAKIQDQIIAQLQRRIDSLQKQK